MYIEYHFLLKSKSTSSLQNVDMLTLYDTNNENICKCLGKGENNIFFFFLLLNRACIPSYMRLPISLYKQS